MFLNDSKLKCDLCYERKDEREFSRARKRLSPYGFRPECNSRLDARDLNPFKGVWGR